MSNEPQNTKNAPAAATEGKSCSSTDAKQDNATASMTPEAKAEKLNAEIKKSWNKLSDDDVKLFAAQPEQFFAKLKEKQGVSKEDAQKRLTEIKASCGSCSSEKAA